MSEQQDRERARWGTIPNLLSFVRIPLGIMVWFYPHDHAVVVALVFAAALTDGMDGWVARLKATRYSPARARAQAQLGAWLDPFCDKVFIVLTAAAIAWAHEAPISAMLLVLTREILLVPFLVGYRFMSQAWRDSHSLTARWPGKLCTVAQFMAVVLAMIRSPAFESIAWITGLLGVYATGHYVATALKHQDALKQGR